MPEPILLEIDGAVGRIILNRPEARNSLRVADMRMLQARLDEALSSGLRCLLLTGMEGAFCAGRDLKEADPERDDTDALMRDVINPLVATLYEAQIPTIAALGGPALGLGLGLALACDLVLTAPAALLGSPFRKIGAVLDSGAHFFLRQRIGAARTLDLVLTGRLVDGVEAFRLGLVDRLIGADALQAEAADLARDLASGPTAAFAASKALLRGGFNLRQGLDAEADHQAGIMAGPDGREGIKAFQERRAPNFVGR